MKRPLLAFGVLLTIAASLGCAGNNDEVAGLRKELDALKAATPAAAPTEPDYGMKRLSPDDIRTLASTIKPKDFAEAVEIGGVRFRFSTFTIKPQAGAVESYAGTHDGAEYTVKVTDVTVQDTGQDIEILLVDGRGRSWGTFWYGQGVDVTSQREISFTAPASLISPQLLFLACPKARYADSKPPKCDPLDASRSDARVLVNLPQPSTLPAPRR